VTGDEALATLESFSRGLDAYRRISLEATLRENASALSSAALFAHAVHR
jgi:hypothetical protein